MQLTEHFTLEELIESDTATRLGIENTLSESVAANLAITARLGERIHTALNEEVVRRGGKTAVSINITSGYRCEALEKILCANDFAAWCRRRDVSQDSSWPMYFIKKSHPQGKGMDFKAPAFGTPYQIVKYISSQPDIMAVIDQIIIEATWVHVSWDVNPRGQVKIASFDSNGVPTYKRGLS